MQKSEVVEFFDKCAPSWDAEMIRDDAIINTILDNAEITEGKDILDVACGTGVLIPDYLERKVRSVTAIDISPKMVEIAAAKFTQKNVTIICGDVETTSFEHKFDSIVVYNAFPHFPEPEKLIKALTSQLKPGGTLTIAHGMSRAKIDHCHEGRASKVSIGLMSEEQLAKMFMPELRITTKISDENMYQVAGRYLQ